MKNSLLSRLIVLTACIWCALSVNAYDIEYDGFYFNIIGEYDAEVTYKDTNYNSYSGDLTIPSWVRDDNGQEYVVIAIGANAFKDCTALTHLSIPFSIRRCTGEPFKGCTQLQYIYTQNLKTWCEIDFGGLASNNPLNFAHKLFVNGQPIADAVIPEGTTVINSMAFINCDNLTSITIPNSVTSIGWGSLGFCDNLETVRLGSGITNIEDNAFASSDGIRTIFCDATTPPVIEGADAFSSDVYSNATLVVPESSLSAYQTADYWKNFTSIRAKTFDFYADGFYFIDEGSGNVGITWHCSKGNTYSGVVIVPETVTYQGTTYTVTKVEANAFTRCQNLTSVILPATILTVSYAFYSNNAEGMIEIISLPINPPYGMTQMTADQYANVIVTVPKNSLAAYQADEGWGQFANLTAMTYDFKLGGFFYEITGNNEVMMTRETTGSYNNYSSLTVPSTATLANVTYDVTAINEKTFYELNNLITVTLPSSVKKIGDYAFYKCTNLESVTLSHVDSIGSYSFAYCSSLAQAKFKGNLQSIQGTSFAYCTALQNFERFAVVDNPSVKYDFINGVIFTRKDANKTLVAYPCGKTAITYTVPQGTVNIGQYAFLGNAIIKTVNLPNSLKEIQLSAFRYCTSIMNIEVPKGVTHIRNYAFSGCTSLESVLLPSTLTFLGGAAFHDDVALTSVSTKAKTPPTCATVGSRPRLESFDTDHYTLAMLNVPTGYKTAYMAADTWMKFSTIRERDSLLEVDVLLGDVDGDGSVGISDVTALIDYILGGGNINMEVADVDGDGTIGIADVTAIIDMILS